MRYLYPILIRMSSRQHLVTTLEAFAAARQLSLSRVSTLVFNHGDMHRRLTEGADITVGRLEAAMRWLSDNWPEATPWPEGIARPEREAA